LLQQERSVEKTEWATSCSMYPSDYKIVKDFRDRKGLKSIADAAKVIVEYANARGALA
jgi:hypothetical protein